MKRILSLIFALATAAVLCTGAFAAKDDYTFTLLADGESKQIVKLGDTVKITLLVEDNHQSEFELYSMQDYICFNTKYLRVVEGSILTYPASEGKGTQQILNASAIKFGASPVEHENRVFMNRVSSSPVLVRSGSALLSFELEAVKVGTTKVTHDTIEVFEGLEDFYSVDEKNASITIVRELEPEEPDTPDQPDVPPCTHSWGKGEETTPADCDTPGVKTYTCSQCGEKKTEVIPPYGHEYKDGTCGVCGEKDPGYTPPEDPDQPDTPDTPDEPDEPDTPDEPSGGGGGGGGGGFFEDTVIVNVKLNGAKLKGDNFKGEYEVGDRIILPEAEKEGHIFKGWSDGTKVWPAGSVYFIYDEVTFTPVWEKIGEGVFTSDHIAYVQGYDDGTVRPEGQITRAEVATILYRVLNSARRDEIFTAVNTFTDVPANLWYNKAVSSMANGGYISGYPDGSFGGGRNITRAEFVTMIVRMNSAEKGTKTFTDVTAQHWAYESISAAASAGWIQGYADGSFHPDAPISRAEAITILNRVLNRGVNATSQFGSYTAFRDNADATKWYYYEVIEATNAHTYSGTRPAENWTGNTVSYVYDAVKYEQP